VVRGARLCRQLFCRNYVIFQLLQIALQFCAAILKPRDHLCVRKTQILRNLVPVCGRQILLIQETLFQLVNLLICESRARLPALLRRRVFPEKRRLLTSLGVWKVEKTSVNLNPLDNVYTYLWQCLGDNFVMFFKLLQLRCIVFVGRICVIFQKLQVVKTSPILLNCFV